MSAMLRRRLFALIAAFAVSFGALWPLVSLAKPATPAIPSFLCTQAGGPVEHPGTPAGAGDEFHCPLCIAVSEAVVAALPVAHVVPVSAFAVVTGAPRAVPDRLFLARPPPSRAPPFPS